MHLSFLTKFFLFCSYHKVKFTGDTNNIHVIRKNKKSGLNINFGTPKKAFLNTETNSYDVMQYVEKPAENIKGEIFIEKQEIKCFCSKRLRKTKYYYMVDCCCRVFHTDCYLEYLWLQLEAKEKKLCMYCKNQTNVQLCVIDPKILHYKESFYMNEQSALVLYAIFERCTQYDYNHR